MVRRRFCRDPEKPVHCVLTRRARGAPRIWLNNYPFAVPGF